MDAITVQLGILILSSSWQWLLLFQVNNVGFGRGCKPALNQTTPLGLKSPLSGGACGRGAEELDKVEGAFSEETLSVLVVHSITALAPVLWLGVRAGSGPGHLARATSLTAFGPTGPRGPGPINWVAILEKRINSRKQEQRHHEKLEQVYKVITWSVEEMS